MLHALVLRTCRRWSNAEKKGRRGDEKGKDEKCVRKRGGGEMERGRSDVKENEKEETK
jgi:hypothetical protein